MAWITYPIASGTKLYALPITGGLLAASALTDETGASINNANPLPIAGSVTVSGVATATKQDEATAAIEAVVNALAGTLGVQGSVAVSNLPADPPTATNQTTGNTSLASILSALAGGLPAALGTAGGLKAALVDIGTAATAALQTTGNGYLQTIAGAISGGRALVTEASASTIATNTGRIPAQGQALAAGSTPVVLPAAQDVVAYAPAKETGGNLATATGYLSTLAGIVSGGRALVTEASASTIAGYLATLAARLPAQGIALSAGSLPVVNAIPAYDKQASLAAAGKTIKATAGYALYIFGKNTTGGAIYFQIHDGTSQPGAGAQPIAFSTNSIGNNAVFASNLGHTVYGAPCQTAVYLVASSTQDTYTAIASTSITYTIYYL